jgi:hypothetical protein
VTRWSGRGLEWNRAVLAFGFGLRVAYAQARAADRAGPARMTAKGEGVPMTDMPDRKRWGRLAWVSVAIGLIIALLITAAMANPLRKSDAALSAWMLAQTPRGSSINDVRIFLDKRGWNEPGYHKTLPAPAAEPFLGGTIGSCHELRRFPWTTFVQAFWEFDHDGRLVNIRIQRTIDSP